MSTLMLLSISLLLSAVAGSIALWIRSGEIRVGLFGALFFLVAVHQGLSAWTEWDTPLLLNGTAVGAFASLAVGALSIFAIVALWRTLTERDRVERLHWDSMEAVRMMNELAAADRVSFDEKVAKLLQIGTSRFGLEVGMISRVKGDRYEVIAIHAAAGFPVPRGAVFSLAETFCRNTVGSERPIGIECISESPGSEPLARAAFGFDSYLGAAIRVDGAAYGTLSFGSAEPHRDRFTQTDKDLLRLMAQWLGNEMAKSQPSLAGTRPDDADAPTSRSALDAPARGVSPEAIPAPAPRRLTLSRADSTPATRRESQRLIDPDRILRRMEGELRTLAGDQIELVFKLDPELGLAAVQRVPLDAIARALVMNARDAMADGGKLIIETANLEFAAGEPGVMPAVAPNRYVTVSFRDTGAEPDADTLSRLYDPPAAKLDPAAQHEGRLALSTIYRILQISGGDLSVDVEPGRGSTFQVFLPRADDRAQVPRRPGVVTAPGPGPKLH